MESLSQKRTEVRLVDVSRHGGPSPVVSPLCSDTKPKLQTNPGIPCSAIVLSHHHILDGLGVGATARVRYSQQMKRTL